MSHKTTCRARVVVAAVLLAAFHVVASHAFALGPQAGQAAGSFDPQVLAGEWNWVSGQRLVITADGRIEVWQGASRINTGTWTCSDPGQRRYGFRHALGGWVDTVTLSADATTLQGTNNAGSAVQGSRIRGAAKALPPQPKASGY